MASWFSPAWSPPWSAPDEARPPSRACARVPSSTRCSNVSPTMAPRSAAIARPGCWSRRSGSSIAIRARHGARSPRRSRARSAAAPATSRSSTPSKPLAARCAASLLLRRFFPPSTGDRPMAGSDPRPFNVLGKPLRRVDALGKVTGDTRFADDFAMPGMLYLKLSRSTVPHARIAAIDVSRALAVDGVRAVLTGKDFPVPFGILPVSQDEHALCPDKVRFVGDPVAAVVATEELIAEEAARLVEVSYEPLATIASPEEALRVAEPRIQDHGDGGNIHKLVALDFGDVPGALAGADLVVEDLFFYQGNTHLPLEQHATLAYLGIDGRLTIASST